MPTLLGVGYGNYRQDSNNFILSFLLHVLLGFILIFSAQWFVSNKDVIQQRVTTLIDTSDLIMPIGNKTMGGGGGGGDASKLNASKGKPPKFDMNQITPPTAVIKNPDPKLPVDQTIMIPPTVKLPTSATDIGDPLSKALMASNGTGVGSGIGSGKGGGIGPGNGRGLGPGEGAGYGGGVFRVGGGVSAPDCYYKPEPEFTEEARKLKYQGTVVLSVIVDSAGRLQNIRVVRGLGLGLDENAIKSAQSWRCNPGLKDGKPVATYASVEIAFNLY